MNEKTFSRVIEDCILKFDQNAIPYFYDQAKCRNVDLNEIVGRHHFLPLLFDWFAFCAVHPNGEMVWYDFEEPDKLEIINDKRIRNIAMAEGAKQFPELTPFIPQRTSEDIDCPHCRSTDEIPPNMPENVKNNIRCYCGELGWVPAGSW